MNKKAFTLLELLVVVLIIGVLAAIALPQYKLAVGKAKYSTLKNVAKSVAESAQRYYLVNNIYPRAAKDLDISFKITSGFSGGWFTILNDINCYIWPEGQQAIVTCGRKIFNTDMHFFVNRETLKPSSCVVYSINKNDIPNRICQHETGKTAGQVYYCQDSACTYLY